MESVPYRGLCTLVLCLVTGLVFVYSGVVGLLVFATATAIGMLPGFVGVKRTHCMGVIMVPCILYFAGAKGAVLRWLGL
jgi:putative membrane protein